MFFNYYFNTIIIYLADLYLPITIPFLYLLTFNFHAISGKYIVVVLCNAIIKVNSDFPYKA